MNTLEVTVDSISAVMAAGYTLIRVYRSTTEAGVYALDGTITLVAGTESYTYTDVDGTVTHWYKVAYYGAGPGESTLSAARRSDTSSAYASLEELHEHVDLNATTDDVELGLLLDAASKAIDRFCNRPDGFHAAVSASTRYFYGSGMTYQFLDEFVAITTVSVKDSASDTSYTGWATPTTNFAGDGDWIPFAGDPNLPDFNPIVKGKPFNGVMIDPNGSYSTFVSGLYTSKRGFRPLTSVSRNVPTVQILGRWGYADTIPDTIKIATIMQTVRWYNRLHSAMADALASAEFGQLRYIRELDPDIRHLLVGGRYIKPVV